MQARHGEEDQGRLAPQSRRRHERFLVDLPLTQVQDGTLVSVAAWYDNEMGYAARLAEVAAFLAR